MGSAFFDVCALIFLIGIFQSSGTTRLIWFFTGVFFFQDRIVLFTSPTIMDFHRFLIYALLIAELIHPKELYQQFRSFPLKKSFLIVLIGMICVGVFDQRHDIILSIYRTVDQFIEEFAIIFLSYVNFKRNGDWKQLFNFLLVASIVLCLFGFYVFITKSNPYDNLITNLYNNVSVFDQYALTEGERFRVNSFVTHPIYYGYLSGVLLLLTFFHFVYKQNLKKVYLFAMVIIFLNLLISNSRLPLIVTIIGLLIFVIIGLNRKAKIAVALYGFLICLAIYNVPVIQSKINDSLDIFVTGGKKVKGSSVNMRSDQLGGSYNEFKKSPIFGNGIFYTQENLGFVSVKQNTSDDKFQGFESYVYLLLIEQGSVGILVNLIFFISIGRYFLRNMAISKQFAGLGFTILIMFLIFIIGTGTLGSWNITLGMIGILICTLDYTIKVDKIYSELIKKALVENGLP
jgi:hypothetical protein